jgi:ribosome-associated translation inhibitor RaiA/cold shock CspA family protein
MQEELQITWRDMEASDALGAKIREQVQRLERFYDRIIACRVMVEQLHRHKHKGNLFNVRIDLSVPGREIVVTRDSGKDHAHEDPYVVVRDTFKAARRQLEDYVHRHRGDVKAHEPPPHGRIVELHPESDYGRLESSDGRLIYFHRNSVLNRDLDSLKVGTEVRFAEEMGDEGPQASSVSVLGKHHLPE